jgi:hypothetical protein
MMIEFAPPGGNKGLFVMLKVAGDCRETFVMVDGSRLVESSPSYELGTETPLSTASNMED